MRHRAAIVAFVSLVAAGCGLIANVPDLTYVSSGTAGPNACGPLLEAGAFCESFEQGIGPSLGSANARGTTTAHAHRGGASMIASLSVDGGQTEVTSQSVFNAQRARADGGSVFVSAWFLLPSTLPSTDDLLRLILVDEHGDGAPWLAVTLHAGRVEFASSPEVATVTPTLTPRLGEWFCIELEMPFVSAPKPRFVVLDGGEVRASLDVGDFAPTDQLRVGAIPFVGRTSWNAAAPEIFVDDLVVDVKPGGCAATR
jgi:hypothetical protein